MVVDIPKADEQTTVDVMYNEVRHHHDAQKRNYKNVPPNRRDHQCWCRSETGNLAFAMGMFENWLNKKLLFGLKFESSCEFFNEIVENTI